MFFVVSGLDAKAGDAADVDPSLVGLNPLRNLILELEGDSPMSVGFGVTIVGLAEGSFGPIRVGLFPVLVDLVPNFSDLATDC